MEDTEVEQVKQVKQVKKVEKKECPFEVHNQKQINGLGKCDVNYYITSLKKWSYGSYARFSLHQLDGEVEIKRRKFAKVAKALCDQAGVELKYVVVIFKLKPYETGFFAKRIENSCSEIKFYMGANGDEEGLKTLETIMDGYYIGRRF